MIGRNTLHVPKKVTLNQEFYTHLNCCLRMIVSKSVLVLKYACTQYLSSRILSEEVLTNILPQKEGGFQFIREIGSQNAREGIRV